MQDYTCFPFIRKNGILSEPHMSCEYIWHLYHECDCLQNTNHPKLTGSRLDLKKIYSIKCVRWGRINSNQFTEDLKWDVNL